MILRWTATWWSLAKPLNWTSGWKTPQGTVRVQRKKYMNETQIICKSRFCGWLMRERDVWWAGLQFGDLPFCCLSTCPESLSSRHSGLPPGAQFCPNQEPSVSFIISFVQPRCKYLSRTHCVPGPRGEPNSPGLEVTTAEHLQSVLIAVLPGPSLPRKKWPLPSLWERLCFHS